MGSLIQIEQKPELEKRLGISINNIGARTVHITNFEVIFEITVLNGGQFQKDIKVVVLLYDYSGNLITRVQCFFSAEKVFSFSSDFIYLSDITENDVKKIVVYPEAY